MFIDMTQSEPAGPVAGYHGQTMIETVSTVCHQLLPSIGTRPRSQPQLPSSASFNLPPHLCLAQVEQDAHHARARIGTTIMHDSALNFSDGKGYWRADQGSVLFYGSHGREEFAFLVTAQALGHTGGQEETPTAQTALDLFRAHHGVLSGIALDMWTSNSQAQADYLITQEIVASRRI